MPVYRDTALLYGEFRRSADALAKYLIASHKTGLTKTKFEVFETYRDPFRQKDLIAKGVSKAGPYQSAHQFGLAADFVPVISPDEAAALSALTGERHIAGWNWHSSHDYRFLAASAQRFQMSVPISWDPCHVQHPEFDELLSFMKHYQ